MSTELPPWLATLTRVLETKGGGEIFLRGITAPRWQDRGPAEILAPLFPKVEDSILAIQDWALTCGRRLDPLCPSAGGEWEEGRFRWQAVIPPAVAAPVFALRRHRFHELSPAAFGFEEGDWTPEQPLLICGPSGSGKTSLLAALLQRYAREQRVVILEDQPELAPLSESWVHAASRPADTDGQGAVDLDHLFAAGLRLRPDRFVVGEVNRLESLVFLDALVAGHRGVWATIHSEGIRELRSRLRFLMLRRYGQAVDRVGVTIPCLFMKAGATVATDRWASLEL